MFAKVNGKDVLKGSLHSQVLPIRKLFQACKSAAEDLFREERGNELQRDLREMMRFLRINEG